MLDRLDLFHRIQFGLVLFRSHMIALISRKSMIKIGRLLGGLAYYLWPDRRRIALSNLDLGA
jgi:lauroyl/myristoyl acyltransferase